MSQLLILGVTSRAAAASALRAGLQPLAADMFADTDLAATCPTTRVRSYPFGLIAAARAYPACPWLYTGALENYPQVIAAIGESRPLLGNSAEVVREVRDPWKLGAWLRRAGFQFPPIRSGTANVPSGEWLCKPFRSAGGRGIHSWKRPEESAGDARSVRTVHTPPSRLQHASGNYYLQRRIKGVPLGAVYVAARSRATLLGVTQQLIGCPWAGARGWWYVGSVGPVELPLPLESEFERLGQCLASHFSLEGLFGVDVILNADGVWTLEVNPRYTASVEILERIREVSAVSDHVAACQQGEIPHRTRRGGRACWGKAVVYAQRSLVIGPPFHRLITRMQAEAREAHFADIPAVGWRLEAGQPITTVFAQANSIGQVEYVLQEKVKQVWISLRC